MRTASTFLTTGKWATLKQRWAAYPKVLTRRTMRHSMCSGMCSWGALKPAFPWSGDSRKDGPLSPRCVHAQLLAPSVRPMPSPFPVSPISDLSWPLCISPMPPDAAQWDSSIRCPVLTREHDGPRHPDSHGRGARPCHPVLSAVTVAQGDLLSVDSFGIVFARHLGMGMA